VKRRRRRRRRRKQEGKEKCAVRSLTIYILHQILV
jgi:hypothetical protein